jgi:alcohol dehydrogenase class IV
MQRIRRALGATGSLSAAVALYDLARDNGAPVALKDIGMKEADLDRAAEIAVSNPYWNPREIGAGQQAAILRLLQDAFVGQRPG